MPYKPISPGLYYFIRRPVAERESSQPSLKGYFSCLVIVSGRRTGAEQDFSKRSGMFVCPVREIYRCR